MLNAIKELFSDKDGRWSSKRFFGGIGFLCCLYVLIYCTMKVIQAPTITDVFLMTSAMLIGLETVTSIWSSRNNKEDNNSSTEE